VIEYAYSWKLSCGNYEDRYATTEEKALVYAKTWVQELFERTGEAAIIRVSYLPEKPQWEPRYVVNVIGSRMAERGEW